MSNVPFPGYEYSPTYYRGTSILMPDPVLNLTPARPPLSIASEVVRDDRVAGLEATQRELRAIARGEMGPSRIAAMFEESVEENKPDKSAINQIVMDYLIAENYPNAAEKFAQETNMAIPTSSEDIEQRVKVRNLIHIGAIEEAIGLINEIDPAILDNQRSLHFSLLQAQLVEIIRSILTESSNPAPVAFQPALKFASEKLAPAASNNPKFLEKLNATMVLALYAEEKMPVETKALLDTKLRVTLAHEVNSALLLARGEQPEARIRQLVRARAWAEKEAREAGAPLPPTLPLGLEGRREQNGGANGGDPMVQ